MCFQFKESLTRRGGVKGFPRRLGFFVAARASVRNRVG